jgi:hypothetical protein
MSATAASLLLLGVLTTPPGNGPTAGPGAGPAAAPAAVPDPAPAAGEGEKEGAKGKKVKGRFTVGRETTYVTGPIDADGYIDYAAALNERLGKGVTPENNANVLLWKALGPHPDGATMPDEFFKWLGIPPLPEAGDYFIDIKRYAQDHLPAEQKEGKDLDDRMVRARQRPWTAQEHPDLAAWLKANEKPLALVVEASRRTHYFSPLVTTRPGQKESSGLIGALLPAVQKCRSLVAALAARAMLRVSEGAVDEAWQDLLACHRLGRLVGRGGTLIEGLVGIAIDAIACRADLAFLERARPDADRLARYQRDLQSLPPFPAAADKVDLGERFMFLDSVMMLDRHGINYLEGLADGKPRKQDPAVERAMQNMNWDPTMRNGNRWYDRLAAAMREPDRATRQKKLDQIEADLKQLKEKTTRAAERAQELLATPDGWGNVIGDVLIGLLVPATGKVQNADDRARQIHDNTVLAFALARYHRDQGRYPGRLEALALKYLERVPLDLFSGKALVYRPRPDGYLLYSVGTNGQDEGGRGADDDPRGDDLSVRMPPPEPKRK